MIKNMRLQGRLIACAAIVAVLAIVATITPSFLVMNGLIDRAGSYQACSCPGSGSGPDSN